MDVHTVNIYYVMFYFPVLALNNLASSLTRQSVIDTDLS